MSGLRTTLVALLTLVLAASGQAGDGAYRDPNGDSGRVPDIRTVAVSTSADGRAVAVRARVKLTSRAFLALMLDTNGRPGPDRAVVVVGRTPGGMLVTIVVNGAGDVVPSTTVRGSIAAGVVRLSLPRRPLAIGRHFDFWLMSGLRDEAATDVDRAPNAGSWHYDLSMSSAPVRRLSGDAF